MGPIRAIAFINNPISATLTHQDLLARGIALGETAVILARRFDFAWLKDCADVIRYPARPSNSILGQRRFIGFYRAAAKLVRRVEREGALRDIYIVNNDNLIASHLLHVAARHRDITVSVVAEGLMNFQRIEQGNRAGWRWRVKPLLARALGLRYRAPHGHLSGAFEPEVDRVVSFAAEGLKAPPEKVEIIPFPRAVPTRAADPKIALVALTGIAHWMKPDAVMPLTSAFGRWIEAQGFARILVKPHPVYPVTDFTIHLPPHEMIDDPRSLEEIAAELEAGTVLGTCCTGLVTLKLMRPELKVIDFGSDYYQVHAYAGDTSVETVLRVAGVEIVPLESDAGRRENYMGFL